MKIWEKKKRAVHREWRKGKVMEEKLAFE